MPVRTRLSWCCVSALLTLFALPILAAAQSPVAKPLITQSVDESRLAVLKGNTHPLAKPQFDLGEAPDDLPMQRMLLVLKRSPEQEHSLRTLLDNQQDRHSHSYHKWLKPEDFGRQFGPADQDMATVASWLQAHGFQIGRVAKGRNIIEFSGTAGQVREAFHTGIHKYAVNGKEHWANASDPQIPEALTPVVAGIHTLHNFLKQPMLRINPERVPAQIVTGPDGKRQVTFPSSPAFYALGPGDFYTIYGMVPILGDGQGVGASLAVVGRSDLLGAPASLPSDVYNFSSVFSFPQPLINFVLNGPDPGDLGGGEEAEATLDISWSEGIADQASFYFVISATTNTTDGIDLSESYIIDNNLADVMTESFGTCEAALTSTELAGYGTLAEQAAAQGITYFVSTGDAGAEGCDSPDFESVASGPISVNALASTPYTVAVGGTMFNENGNDSKYWSSSNAQNFESALSYIPEDVWNESCESGSCPTGVSPNIAAGSGGASQYFTKPSWQSGTGVPNDGWRDIPDVSLNAAAGHDPYLLCLDASCVPDSQGFIQFAAVGGTSASAPAFAGIMTIIDSIMGGRQGHADYILYRLAAGETLSQCNASGTSSLPNSTCIFNDITSGNNAVPGEVGYGAATADYSSGTGYDLATGLGSVNVANLVNKWNSVIFNATTTNLTLNPTSNIAHGTPVTVTASVTPNSGGPATGDLALEAANNTSGGSSLVQLFTLSGGSTSGTTSALPGGTYNVTAHYGGDSSFASSDSMPVSVTVTPEASTTALTLFSINSSGVPIPYSGGVYGTFVYPRADVAGQSGEGVPTGGVNFLDGTNNILNVASPLNSQGNTAPPLGIFTLGVGAHSMTAAYTGDASFNASTSAPVTFNITQATTTVTVASTGSTTGATLNATVNTTSGGNAPSGTVAFYVNSAQVGSPIGVIGNQAVINIASDLITTPASATASYTDSNLTAGNYTVKAVYSGDSNYLGSSGSGSIIVQSDFSFTASGTSLNVSAPGSTGTLTFTVAPLDAFNSQVGFTISGLPAGAQATFSPTSVTGSGNTTLTITTTAAAASNHIPGSFPFTSLAGVLAGVILLKRKSGRATLLIVAMACALSLPGCGGGSSSSGSGGSSNTPPPAPIPTPVGSSTVTVTATSGTLRHSATFTLNVQ